MLRSRASLSYAFEHMFEYMRGPGQIAADTGAVPVPPPMGAWPGHDRVGTMRLPGGAAGACRPYRRALRQARLPGDVDGATAQAGRHEDPWPSPARLSLMLDAR